MNYTPDIAELNRLHQLHQFQKQKEKEENYQKHRKSSENDLLDLEESCTRGIINYYKEHGTLPKNTDGLYGCSTDLPYLYNQDLKRFQSEMKGKYGDGIDFYEVCNNYDGCFQKMRINRKF